MVFENDYDSLKVVQEYTEHAKIVYSGRQRATMSRCFITEFLVNTPRSYCRAAHEISTVAQLSHTNILRFITSWIETIAPRTTYMYMQTPEVYGDTLERWLESTVSGRQYDVCVRLASQLADAIVYMYDQQITHHDVRPTNVMVNAEETKLFVIGFGKACDHRRKSASCGGRELIYDSSPLYADTEQLNGLCHRFSDFYSLGIIMIEMRSYFGGPIDRILELDTIRREGLCRYQLDSDIEEGSIVCRKSSPREWYYVTKQLLSNNYSSRLSVGRLFALRSSRRYETIPSFNVACRKLDAITYAKRIYSTKQWHTDDMDTLLSKCFSAGVVAIDTVLLITLFWALDTKDNDEARRRIWYFCRMFLHFGEQFHLYKVGNTKILITFCKFHRQNELANALEQSVTSNFSPLTATLFDRSLRVIQLMGGDTLSLLGQYKLRTDKVVVFNKMPFARIMCAST
ncbi:S-TKc serine/threonine protein kinase [Heliothis virescens ascovirus 3h]|uniref:S-TKc serine/threonine protein kinase n=1 Tax=Heliothis virescens ascovirus 3h TaxID=1268039 RepID=A0A386JAP7_9VIRU|nr:S-TKc serine/threonine protein kinase [Heliothis virescens ascovirus 3h]